MHFDNRTWLVWGIAASVPAIVGRNPFVLVELLVIVSAVRWICATSSEWSWVVRVISLLVVINVVFNALTVRSGDRVIAEISDRSPIIGGAITLNAVVYGVVSGLAIFVIVLCWTLVANQLSWSMLMRQVPARFSHIAVAGSVAWSYLPSMRRTLREIRESQASRGWELRGVRDLPALVVPVLAGGLERAVVTSEVLETRGFGGATSQATSSWSGTRLIAGLVGIVTGMYCLAAGQTVAAVALLCVGGGVIIFEARGGSNVVQPTRLRDSEWSRNDTICSVCSLVALLTTVAVYATDSAALAFNPYPVLALPSANPVLMGSLLLLFAPAIVSVASAS